MISTAGNAAPCRRAATKRGRWEETTAFEGGGKLQAKSVSASGGGKTADNTAEWFPSHPMCAT